MYEFTKGGDGDIYVCDFVRDKQQGFNVPAKSLLIENHGGGAGYNYLYFRTTHDGNGWSRTMRLKPDAFVNYQLGEAIFYGVAVWASNANCMFSLDATPGEWDTAEASRFLGSPNVKKNIDALIAGDLVI